MMRIRLGPILVSALLSVFGGVLADSINTENRHLLLSSPRAATIINPHRFSQQACPFGEGEQIVLNSSFEYGNLDHWTIPSPYIGTWVSAGNGAVDLERNGGSYGVMLYQTVSVPATCGGRWLKVTVGRNRQDAVSSFIFSVVYYLDGAWVTSVSLINSATSTTSDHWIQLRSENDYNQLRFDVSLSSNSYAEWLIYQISAYVHAEDGS